MKMIKYVLILMTILLFATGCVVREANDFNEESEPILEHCEKFDSITIKENEFFPYKDGDVLDYTGNMMLDKADKVSGKVDVELLKSCTDGNIFVLRFKDLYKSIAERSNLYFFVSENSIWKLNLHDLLVDDAEKVIESIDSSSDLMDFDRSSNNIFCMVCANDVSILNTNSDVTYYNDGITSEYRYSNSLVETGYYETVIFEQNIGLTKYISGFGALRDHVDLTLIETK